MCYDIMCWSLRWSESATSAPRFLRNQLHKKMEDLDKALKVMATPRQGRFKKGQVRLTPSSKQRRAGNARSFIFKVAESFTKVTFTPHQDAWCLWIFSSTWLFRESGPDANSRDSPEAPGCFGHFWTVLLDVDWDKFGALDFFFSRLQI